MSVMAGSTPAIRISACIVSETRVLARKREHDGTFHSTATPPIIPAKAGVHLLKIMTSGFPLAREWAGYY